MTHPPVHPLAQPLALPCGVTLSTRLCKTAMSEGMADLNNNATPRLETLYRRWAISGAGLLFSGNIQVGNHAFVTSALLAPGTTQPPAFLFRGNRRQ